MDDRKRHEAIDYSHLAMHIAAAFFVVFFAVFVLWCVLSKPNAKLFEADNTVCFSQPFQMECHERGR